ncbi:hypothetical protein [Moorena sp. SIO4G3]|uniref:hypothetical protein n=1 Tax=Moorena sp. SIO4G3 TaxID=2607821 RepID=UPI00142D1533|nr:hypothetical protein [Moorena sp. SIO4G3]NEO76156.1 hypothetical protein [Moorena sp. SIO4G3]
MPLPWLLHKMPANLLANIHGGSENAIKANGDRHSLIEKIDNSDFVVLDDMIYSEPRI